MKLSILKFIFAIALVFLIFRAVEVKADEIPHIDSVSPQSGTLGSSFTITVTGNQFKKSQGGGASSKVHLIRIPLQAIPLPTNVVNGSLLTAIVLNNLEIPAGEYFLMVFNNTPQPGVYSDNSELFTLYNALPEATNLLSSYNCSISPVGMAVFSWVYDDLAPDSDNEIQYQIQIDNNANFSSTAVNRTSFDLNNPPGALNQESVAIRTDSNEVDSLRYNTTYYWRVKVWQESVLWENPDLPPSEHPLNSGWVNGPPFTTLEHPGPYADFSFNNTSPSVIFTNNSICYDNDGICDSYSWNFGDSPTLYDYSLPKFEYNYRLTGEYNVSLTVSDGELQCSVAKFVNAVNPPASVRSPGWREINPADFTETLIPGEVCVDLPDGYPCLADADCCSKMCALDSCAPIAPTWSCGSVLTDSRDTKTYATVLIGSQCWMAVNMNIGTMTAGVNNQGADCPSAAAIEKYCYGDNTDNCVTYGGFYQWDQAMCGSTIAGATGICPTGWHMPTHDEFTTLERSVCSSGSCATDFPYNVTTIGSLGTIEGTTLKTVNSLSFSGLLAGYRDIDGSFNYLGSDGSFWSSLQSGSSNAWYRGLSSGLATVYRAPVAKTYGFPVRCLKN